MKNIINSIIKSWANTDGNVHSTNELLTWIKELNNTTSVSIKECSINDGNFWFYDEDNGEILNTKNSFFSIKGSRFLKDGQCIDEHPIIIQSEIGYLGIICKEIDGELNFLMQAKIEPGNINCVQISPTIQATKSNFTRVHGGNYPKYFEYFENAENYRIIYDQIQSEQSSRFYKKRNRNIIIIIDDEIEIYSNFRWMTLGQIKSLMEIDNLVNMDTRTVISGIPLISANLMDEEKKELFKYFNDKSLFNSIFRARPCDTIPCIYQYINNYKMFREVSTEIVPLNKLDYWDIDQYGITANIESNFMVKYFDISIEGREVRNWTQPLFKAIGEATFGLIISEDNGTTKFLISVIDEIGCFDKVEIGPSIQKEPIDNEYKNIVEKLFKQQLENNEGILLDVMLSEEGGRFYHEQNRNIIMKVDKNKIPTLPEGYFWTDYSTLNYLVQVNNCLNIQLRNLLSLLKI
ncbi:NDP-hexose 2,3-dehydratase family protein [Paraclostridium bifermentans]|uniref:NDP-hexose 2,3-dehydratase family protein n=1 Tax=Paraclostridium bifermentans TaxID=1490 RepID=UPI00189F314E|nr:NDP-hexose 2,3-dehydratase family protein [Paraclostridium bifermentans]